LKILCESNKFGTNVVERAYLLKESRGIKRKGLLKTKRAVHEKNGATSGKKAT